MFVAERLLAPGLWFGGEISASRCLKVAVNASPSHLEMCHGFGFAAAISHKTDYPFS
jgi:hypothetical protein